MLTADVVVLTGEDPGAVLLIQRGNPPFRGEWALPGGYVEEREPTKAAAARELGEETGLTCGALELIGVYDAPDRDPRGWTVSVAYRAVGVGAGEAAVEGGDDASRAQWFPVDELPSLAFDHAEIIADAIAIAAARR
jgi:8-oxo-dGTP diphosphatase